MNFSEHQSKSIKDCREVISLLEDVIVSIENKEMVEFETFWINLEDKESRIGVLRKIVALRYLARKKNLE